MKLCGPVFRLAFVEPFSVIGKKKIFLRYFTVWGIFKFDSHLVYVTC